jgi:hypothetical protein
LTFDDLSSGSLAQRDSEALLSFRIRARTGSHQRQVVKLRTGARQQRVVVAIAVRFDSVVAIGQDLLGNQELTFADVPLIPVKGVIQSDAVATR